MKRAAASSRNSVVGLPGGVLCTCWLLAQVSPPGHWEGHSWFWIQGPLLQLAPRRLHQQCLECSAMPCLWTQTVGVCSSLCFCSRSISHFPLCSLSVADQVLSMAMWTPPRSQAKYPISFCWVRLSTGIGFLKGKVYFPYHCQSQSFPLVVF